MGESSTEFRRDHGVAAFLPVPPTYLNTKSSTLSFLFLFIWWIFHVLQKSYLGAASAKTMADSTTSGSLFNQLLVITLGAFGACFLLRTIRSLVRSRSAWFFAFLAYTFWAGLSVLWSDHHELALRRYLEFLLISIGSIGIGGFFAYLPNGQVKFLQMIKMAGIATFALVMPLEFGDLSVSNMLDPGWIPAIHRLDPELTFSIALALLASLAGQSDKRKAKYKPGGLTSIGSLLFVPFLLLAKWRMILVATSLVAFAVVLILRRKSQELMIISMAAVALMIPVIYSLGDSAIEGLMSIFARGDSARTFGQLNGRTPLWEYVSHDILRQPWTGVGFGSYWTPTRLIDVWIHVGWAAPFAHNGYLDESLCTGYVGLALLLTYFLLAVLQLHRGASGRCRQACFVAIGFIALLLAFNFTDTIFQYYFRCPFYFTLSLIVCCSVVTNSGVRPRRNAYVEAPRLTALSMSSSL